MCRNGGALLLLQCYFDHYTTTSYSFCLILLGSSKIGIGSKFQREIWREKWHQKRGKHLHPVCCYAEPVHALHCHWARNRDLPWKDARSPTAGDASRSSRSLALGYIVQSRLLQSSPNNSKFQKGKQHDAAEVIQALLELTDVNGNEFQDLQKLIAFNRKQQIEGCTCEPKHAELSFINKDLLFLPVCSCHQSKDCQCEFTMKEMCKAAINVEEQVTYECAPKGQTVKKVDVGPDGDELPKVVITSQKRYSKDCCCTSQERIKCDHKVVCGILTFMRYSYVTNPQQ